MLRAVEDVSFAVRKGETLGLVGESGCGKSTLARMIVRLLRPTHGEILFEGKPLWGEQAVSASELPRHIQMVFQDPVSSLNPRKKVGASIQEALDIHRIGNRQQRKERVEELLALVGLRPEQYHRYPHEFSGGQRQRIAIARALVLNPALLVCDEPVSALDVSVQAQVLNLFTELQQRFNLTYLFISHDLAVVRYLCDRVAVMYLGRIVEMGPAQALYTDPQHPYTQALLDVIPVPDPEARKGRERVQLGGDIPSPLRPPSGCPFHTRCPQVMDICRQTLPSWTTRCINAASPAGETRPQSSDREAVRCQQPDLEHRVFCHLYS